MNDLPAAISGLGFARLERGVLKITGADRVGLLHRLTTQNLQRLHAPGQVADTLFTTAQAKTIAWTQLFSDAEALWLVCPLERVARLAQWVDTYTIMEDVKLVDATDDWVYFAAFGDGAAAALGLPDTPAPSSCQPYVLHKQPVGHVTAVIGAMGSGVCGLVAQAAWPETERQLTDAGGIVQGALALEQRRLLAGIPSSMHELQNDPNPLEMRLGPSCISWKKGCYIGQEVISRLDSYDKVARLLMGFRSPQALTDAGVQEQKLFIDGRPIGKITSSVAVAEGCIGLALVKRSAALPGRAHLQIEQNASVIELLDRPFWAPAH